MSTQFVYIRSEPGLFTVGFSDSEGLWVPESDHESPENAAQRVSYLNGGKSQLELAAPDLLAVLENHHGTRYWCSACDFLGDHNDYIEHEDHTCGKCGNANLKAVWIIMEDRALAAIRKGREGRRIVEKWL